MRVRGTHLAGLLFLMLALSLPLAAQNGNFTLTSNPNPSNPGQAVLLTAQGAFSGSVVTFYDAGPSGTGCFNTNPVSCQSLGNPNANSSGTATLTVSNLASGLHQLGACFFNDFPAFRCTNIVNQVVSSPTSLSLSSSQNPSGLCQSVTFTASITPASATGTVTFFDGTTTLTTAQVSRGVATFTTTSLTLGNHNIQARYNPDPGYGGSSGLVNQTVSGAVTVTLSSTPNPSNLGGNVTMTAVVAAASCPTAPPPSATPSGTVTFFDGTTQIGQSNLSNGTATFQTTALTVGTHNLDALYNGDANFSSNTSNVVPQQVNNITKTNTTTTLGASANPITTTQPVVLTANVTPTGATGQVQFRDNGNVIGTGTLSNGSASFTASGLTAGTHPLTAFYVGDNSFNSSTSTTLNEVVNPNQVQSTTALSVNPNPANQGQAVTLTASVTPSSAPGSVQFFDGSVSLGQSNVSGGTASLSVSTFTAGTHTLTARYLGDSVNQPSTSNAVTLTINVVKQNTNTNLSASPSSVASGLPVTLTATVTSQSSGSAAPTGTVTFTDGGTQLGQSQLSNGLATFSTSSLAVGSHNLTATYSGDTNFIGSSGSTTVSVTLPSNQPTTTTLNVAPLTANAGQAVIMGAGVEPTSGSGTVTGAVTFTDNGSPLATVQLSNGSASFQTTSLAPGTHRIVATYNGNATFNSSSSPTVTVTINGNSQTSLTVNPISSTFGQAVALNATVTGTGGTPTGSVTFSDGNTTLGTANLTNGAASFSISTLAVGPHSLVATYSGDSTFVTSSSQPVSVQVGKAATTTVLSANPTSSNQGQAVVLTAKVSSTGAGALTGTVTFMDGATVIGTPATVANGSASITTSNLPNGSHTLTAVYSGDTNFLTSTSAPITISVGTGLTATTTALTASPTAPAAGQPVTFTATVTPPGATGTVTFLDGTTTLGTGTLTASLANGTATFTTSSLTAGAHSITAVYGGDTKFAGSTSTPVTFTIPKANSTTVLTATPNPGTIGQPVALRAVVTPASATGTVTFLDGATALGTGALANGVATLATSALTLGPHSLTASYPGDANFNASTSAAVSEVIATGGPALTNILPTELPKAIVGVPYSVTFTVTGGTGTLTWTLLSGSVPGISLSPGGVLSGTPTAATSTPVTLGIRVTDSTGAVLATAPPLTVLPRPAPAVSSVTATTITDATAPAITISPAYTLPLTATFSLSFTPNASNLPGNYTNPDVLFANGTTISAPVSIPTGSTSATVPAVQLGSVAGTINITLATLVATTGPGQTQSVLPPNPVIGTIVVGRFVPVIVPNSVKITTSPAFSVSLDASSTPRDLISATLTFTAASGATLNGAQLTVPLTAAANTWFADTTGFGASPIPPVTKGVANGGRFSLTIPFAYSGDPAAIGTVSVTLTNSVGNSAAVSGGH